MSNADFIECVTAGDDAAVLAALARDPALASTRNAQGVSVICLAVYRRRLGVAAALAATRSDLDVFEATCIGDLDRVRALLAADPACVNAISPDGFSSVGYSAFFGHLPLLHELIRSGGEVNTPSRNGMRVCPLHSAAATSDQAKAVLLASALLEAGADPNAGQQLDYTPLHEAARNGNRDLVALLLRYGADAARANEQGETAIDLAGSKGHSEVLAMLDRARLSAR